MIKSQDLFFVQGLIDNTTELNCLYKSEAITSDGDDVATKNLLKIKHLT